MGWNAPKVRYSIPTKQAALSGLGKASRESASEDDPRTEPPFERSRRVCGLHFPNAQHPVSTLFNERPQPSFGKAYAVLFMPHRGPHSVKKKQAAFRTKAEGEGLDLLQARRCVEKDASAGPSDSKTTEGQPRLLGEEKRPGAPSGDPFEPQCGRLGAELLGPAAFTLSSESHGGGPAGGPDGQHAGGGLRAHPAGCSGRKRGSTEGNIYGVTQAWCSVVFGGCEDIHHTHADCRNGAGGARLGATLAPSL